MKNILENEIDSRIEILKINFPECFDRDGNFNLQKFDEIINPSIKTFKDSYGINWLGKSYAKRLVSVPISTVLQEDLEHNNQEINKNSENIYIKGDNLEVLRHLSSAYSNKIKLIYIDPPYNTKNGEFVYNDNREFSEKELNIMVEEEIISEGERDRILEWTDKKSSSHSAWLTFMYPRLYLARKLLREDGAIFISIDDNENAQLKLLCDEIFGEENFIENIIWNKRIPKNDKGIGNIHEYILLYAKNKELKHEFLMQKDGLDEIEELLEKAKNKKLSIEESEKELKKLYKKKSYDRGITLYNNINENYEIWGKINMSWPNAETFGPRYNIYHPKTKNPVKVPERGWRWTEATFKKELDSEKIIERFDGSYIVGNIWFAKDEKTQPSSIKYLKDVDKMLLRSILSYKSDGGIEIENLFGNKSFFSYPKSVMIIKSLISSIQEKDFIVLDFFSGSATTAHAVMDLNADDGGNRKYIMVQLEEKLTEGTEGYKYCIDNNLPTDITSIGIERIKKSVEKIKKEKNTDIDYGFKIYSIKDVPNKLILDDSFDPTVKTLFEKNLLTKNEKNALLTTYKVFDGNLLSENIKSLFIGENEVYLIQDILYILNEIRSENFVKELLEKIDKDKEFIVNKIVIYGYESTDGKFRKELTENIKSYNNKKNATINVEVRY